jgi:hypothetical protein
MDLSFKKFVQDLATSGSDKSFLIQRKYHQLLEPIVEDSDADAENRSEERLNFEASESEDSSNQSDEGEIQGYRMGIRALAAPSLEHEHTVVVIPITATHPEIDTS